MATFLDVTTLESFSLIFVFIFVWLVVYAVLLYTKVLGQNHVINILIGLLVAFFVIISEIATLIVKQIAPIFAVVLVFAAIITVSGRMFGTTSTIMGSPQMKYIVLVVLVIALVVGSMAIVRQNVDVPERGEDFGKTSTIIFHPNFLGLVLIFLIAVFTIGLLAVKQT
jgi:hypothetical protein